ncbi:MAG: hypothetical protein MUC67_10705, partial [Acidobacteria bacterium]|nr:hypothetical protein [Acidobacteriota bacterium]
MTAPRRGRRIPCSVILPGSNPGSRCDLSAAAGRREREIRRLLMRAVVIFVLFFFAHGAVAG